jgi:hypothetical protein
MVEGFPADGIAVAEATQLPTQKRFDFGFITAPGGIYKLCWCPLVECAVPEYTVPVGIIEVIGVHEMVTDFANRTAEDHLHFPPTFESSTDFEVGLWYRDFPYLDTVFQENGGWLTLWVGAASDPNTDRADMPIAYVHSPASGVWEGKKEDEGERGKKG